jgi:hypothetical protein
LQQTLDRSDCGVNPLAFIAKSGQKFPDVHAERIDEQQQSLEATFAQMSIPRRGLGGRVLGEVCDGVRHVGLNVHADLTCVRTGIEPLQRVAPAERDAVCILFRKGAEGAVRRAAFTLMSKLVERTSPPSIGGRQEGDGNSLI